jgi:hypothetical protein
MRRPGPATRAAVSLAPWPLIIVFSPVILLAGEPVSQYVMRRMLHGATAAPVPVVGHNASPARAVVPMILSPRVSLLFSVITNPLWIALTAPGRWVHDRFRSQPHQPDNR